MPAEMDGLGAVETRLDEWVFEVNYATRMLEQHFRVATLEGFGLNGHASATAAAGALVHYLRETSAIGARTPEDSATNPSSAASGSWAGASGRHRLLRAAGFDDFGRGDCPEFGIGGALGGG